MLRETIATVPSNIVAWFSLMWDRDPCSGCFHEMRSAFIEVRAIVEDLNARRQRGEQPENKCYESAFYRWHQAIAALAECVGSLKPPLLMVCSPG